MDENTNIGQWAAEVDIDENGGKAPNITVEGTFPTNGRKPLFNLLRNEPQGTNPTDLLLTLIFGTLADPHGSESAYVKYNQAISAAGIYKTATVVDENTRTIASIDVNLKTELES